jgi:hypothetical protein
MAESALLTPDVCLVLLYFIILWYCNICWAVLVCMHLWLQLVFIVITRVTGVVMLVHDLNFAVTNFAFISG